MSEQKNNWPDEIRLEMVDRSKLYENPSVYQYGYYDGYQKALAQLSAPNTGKISVDKKTIEWCFSAASVLETVLYKLKLIEGAKTSTALKETLGGILALEESPEIATLLNKLP